jgi:hypothetical protein
LGDRRCFDQGHGSAEPDTKCHAIGDPVANGDANNDPVTLCVGVSFCFGLGFAFGERKLRSLDAFLH